MIFGCFSRLIGVVLIMSCHAEIAGSVYCVDTVVTVTRAGQQLINTATVVSTMLVITRGNMITLLVLAVGMSRCVGQCLPLIDVAKCMVLDLCHWLVALCVWSRICVVCWWRHVYGAESMSLVGGVMCKRPHLCHWLVVLCVWSCICVIGWWHNVYEVAYVSMGGGAVCMEPHLCHWLVAPCVWSYIYVIGWWYYL